MRQPWISEKLIVCIIYLHHAIPSLSAFFYCLFLFLLFHCWCNACSVMLFAIIFCFFCLQYFTIYSRIRADIEVFSHSTHRIDKNKEEGKHSRIAWTKFNKNSWNRFGWRRIFKVEILAIPLNIIKFNKMLKINWMSLHNLGDKSQKHD